MILLLLLLYLSYLHVAKNKINTQYRNIDAVDQRKIAPPRLSDRSEQTPRLPRLKNAPAPSAVKRRGVSFGQKFNLFLNIVAFFLSIIAENVIIVCVNGVLSVTL